MKNTRSRLNVKVPDKALSMGLAPNPATGELRGRLEGQGIETVFDRFDSQQPQCSFGLSDLCCRMCMWGPCRIGPKSERGICGRDINAIVMANQLRALAAGMSCQGMHAREIALTLMAAAEGKANLGLKGACRVLDVAKKLGMDTSGISLQEAAGKIAAMLVDDLGRLTYKPMAMLEAYAPSERKETWERLGILPRSVSYEIMESMHMTALGGCTDWKAMAAQELRSALAYCYGTLFGTSFATEMLYGIPKPLVTEVNYGVLKKDHVNILIHGHSPVMVEKVVEKINSHEMRKLAASVGAKGIVIGGMCCTGNSLLAQYGIPTVTNVMGQELALGTGAIDAVIVDMQCVIPGMKMVADCFGTEIITTCNSNRIPGAIHIPFDPEKPERLDDDAMLVARRSVEAFARRNRSNIYIPDQVTRAMSGWSYESIMASFDGKEKLAGLLKDGTITGIVTIIGCNSPKVPYESNPVIIGRNLIKEGVLVTTTGCSAHALFNAGLCAPEAARMASPGLRKVCEELDIPPVLAIGSCVDNARTLRLFIDLSDAAGIPMKDMPFMLACPEPGNEKSLGHAVAFLCHGISCLTGQTAPKHKAGLSDNIEAVEFLKGDGLKHMVGARLYTESDPEIATKTILAHIRASRKAAEWD